ncbi:hypothetical protein GCM10029978_067690 [Actinoallomurus acanthiterrae]
MRHNGTAPVTLTLPRRHWELVVYGLTSAAAEHDNRGGCDCSDAVVSICDSCAASDAASITWRHLAKQLQARLGDRTRRLTLVHTVNGWREIALALEEGADSLGAVMCVHYCGGSCGDCAEWRRDVPALYALAARIERRCRRTHARAGQAGAAHLLPAELTGLDGVVQIMAHDLGDQLGNITLSAGQADLYALLDERRHVTAYLARRPRCPRGTRPRHHRRGHR